MPPATYPELPHAVVEALCKTNLTSRESRLLWFVIRHTYGWHGKANGDWLTNSQFQAETGMSKGSVSETLKLLLWRRIVLACEENSYRKRFYRVNENVSDWIEGSNRLERSRRQERSNSMKPIVPTVWNHLAPKKVPDGGGTQEGPRSRSKATDTKKGQQAPVVPTNEIPFDELQRRYNELCPSLPKCLKLTDSRRKSLGARWRELPDLDSWLQFFRRVEASDWLSGRTQHSSDHQNWKPDIGWILKPDRFAEILEGKYDNRHAPESGEEVQPRPKLSKLDLLSPRDRAKYEQTKQSSA